MTLNVKFKGKKSVPMQGANVLHPIGWDAFGLPAEQYALQTGTHPRVTTERNVNRFREQLQSLGELPDPCYIQGSRTSTYLADALTSGGHVLCRIFV
jgi:hypothetical protein